MQWLSPGQIFVTEEKKILVQKIYCSLVIIDEKISFDYI